MLCQVSICLILRWKCNLASIKRPGAIGVFSVVAFVDTFSYLVQVKKESNPIALEIDPCNSFNTEVSGLSGASNSGTCSTGSIKSQIFYHGTWWYSGRKSLWYET